MSTMSAGGTRNVSRPPTRPLARLAASALSVVVLVACGPTEGSGSDGNESGGSTDSSATDDPTNTSNDVTSPSNPPSITANVTTTPHADAACSGTFVRHDLDHVTTPRAAQVAAMTDGTGAGVLIDDLDGDGGLDIVLPNLSGDTTIFWNASITGGVPTFERHVLTGGRFRQAISLDVDIDGDRDLLLSTGIGPPIAFIHDGRRGFERTEFRTRAVAFSMAPGDLDGDGTVEVVTGSYNAELTANRDNRALTGVDVGVAVHHPDGTNLATGVDHEFLTDTAQALATLVVDINGDGLDDVVVGNDLGTPDQIWLGDSRLPGVAGLTATELFDVTSLSTMSLDLGDIDNDGDLDLFSTDMAPLPGEPADVWAGVMADIEQARVDDIQIPRNVVQIADERGYTEQAEALGVAATGWSWSGLLGDLDNDGMLDVVVVNGMQATAIFDMLPDGELVEPNQAFANTGRGFVARPEWQLDALEGGRGMAQGDLDNDGDLDIVVNNLGAPSTLWENQACSSDAPSASIIVEPIWTGVQNLDALATQVVVSDGTVDRRGPITGTRGYISTSATQAHIGLGTQPPETVTVTVRWPDGGATVLDGVSPGVTLRIERTAAPLGTEAATESAGEGR